MDIKNGGEEKRTIAFDVDCYIDCLSNGLRTICDYEICVNLKNGECYYPSIPRENEISIVLNKIAGAADIDSALELFCYVVKGQFFNDGNKRTATLITNLFMIQNGLGIVSIAPERTPDFYNALTDYYMDETKKDVLKAFMHSCCITE